MKINLVLLIDVLEDIQGGTERQVYELLKHIDREKFKIALFVLHQKKVPQEIEAVGNRSKGLGIKRIYGINGIIEGLKFYKFIKKERVDIVMTYHFSSDIWGTVFGRLSGVPVIISNRRDEGFWRKKIHILAYKLVNTWVNRIVVVSQTVKKVVINEEGVIEDKIEVVYNGVDIERFSAGELAGYRVDGLPNAKIIGCIGNLREVKGQHILINAAFDVIKEMPDVHFVLVGDGEAEEELKLKAKNLDIEDNVHFMGKRNDVPGLLAKMDVCVIPSLSEGMSNALLEYMAAAKPVIATDVGGNAEVIENEKNGILVPANDHVSLARGIKRLLQNPEFAYSLGIKARETVIERINLQKQIRLLENRLESLVPKKEIRVMHLISSVGFFGAEKVMFSLAKNMNYNGIKSFIVTINNLHNPHIDLIRQAELQHIPAEIVESRGRFDLNTVRQIAKIIRKNNVSLIHAHNYKANFLGFLAARKAKIPIVATNHLWIQSGLKLKFYELIDALILRNFIDKVVAVSESIRKDMVKRGVPSSKIELILNAIGERAFQANKQNLRDELKIPQQVLLIGIVARLSQEKGHKYFFEAIRNILRDKPDIVVLVVGEGLLKADLEKLVADLGIAQRVIFTGYQKDMDRVYGSIDILVQASLREGLPITLLEAMSFAKPIIATDTGGTSHLIKNGQTGLLVNPADAKALYQAILSLLKDTPLRNVLGGNARRFVNENYSLEKMLSSYKKVYEGVLA